MPHGASARLFVAIDPPGTVCERLAGWARQVESTTRARGGLRVLDAGVLHVTLCFLGSRPVGEIEQLSEALAACEAPAFELSLGAPIWLPVRRARSLAVEVHDDSGALARLHEWATEALSSICSWQPERRRYRPHITLARVRGDAERGRSRHARVDPSQPLPATPRVSFQPEALVLYRSWLAPEGASYDALASSSFALG